MQYIEFLNDPDSRKYVWHITKWPAAVQIALGGQALWWFRGAFIALLTPTILLAAYSFDANRPKLLIVVFLSYLGFRNRSMLLTGIGIVFHLLIALGGLGIAIAFQDRLIVVAGLLPGATWLGSCMILGMTGQYLTDALQESEPKFQTLISRGILLPIEIAKKNADGGPDTETESLLPSDKNFTETGTQINDVVI